MAALAPAERVASLGIDVEPATALDPEMARAILRTDEPDLDAHLAFTMKEAVYKAWSRLGGPMLDHHDVRLSLGPGDRFEGAVDGSDARLAGRWAEPAGHWLALVAVPIGTAGIQASLGRQG